MTRNELRRTLVIVFTVTMVSAIGAVPGLATEQPLRIDESGLTQYEKPDANSSEYAVLWSGDQEDIRRGDTDAKIAVSDVSWDRPPAIASKWNEKVLQPVNTSSITVYDRANISTTGHEVETGTEQWSVIPIDANTSQGEVIRDAYVEVHSVSSSIQYHTDKGTTTVVKPSGTVRILTDLGIKTDKQNISVKEVNVNSATITDEGDGKVIGSVEDAETGSLSVDYEGFDAGHRGMKIEANLSVTYTGGGANTTNTETISVTDKVTVQSQSVEQANGTIKKYPNGTTALHINTGTPYWDTINMSGDRTVNNVWRYYTAASPGHQIVARNGSVTAKQGEARAAQVHAYPARKSPSINGSGRVKTVRRSGKSPALGENIDVDEGEMGRTTAYPSVIRIFTEGDTPDSVSVSSGVENADEQEVSLSHDEESYKKANLEAEIVDTNAKEGTKTILVNLTDLETGDGIDTLGKENAGNITVGDKTVETNTTGMATVEISENTSASPSYNPGDRPGRERYIPAGGKRNSIKVESEDNIGVKSLLDWVVDFSPVIVPGLMSAYLLDRMGIIRSWPPWELVR